MLYSTIIKLMILALPASDSAIGAESMVSPETWCESRKQFICAGIIYINFRLINKLFVENNCCVINRLLL